MIQQVDSDRPSRGTEDGSQGNTIPDLCPLFSAKISYSRILAVDSDLFTCVCLSIFFIFVSVARHASEYALHYTLVKK